MTPRIYPMLVAYERGTATLNVWQGGETPRKLVETEMSRQELAHLIAEGATLLRDME